jgi:methyl-accepting chemotaxis protein
MNNKRIEEIQKELKEIDEEVSDLALTIYDKIELTENDLKRINEKRQRIFDLYQEMNEEIEKESD